MEPEIHPIEKETHMIYVVNTIMFDTLARGSYSKPRVIGNLTGTVSSKL